MKLTRFVRKAVRDTEMGLGLSGRYLRKMHGAVIVTYHGVEPRELITEPGIQSIHVDPKLLTRQLEFLARHFTVIGGINELQAAPTASNRPFALVTFDDGYKNFLTHALPVLEAIGIPSTLFVTGNCIENDTRHPAYICRATIGNLEPGTYDLVSISESLSITLDNRVAVGRGMAERMKHLPWDQAQLLIEELESLFSTQDLQQIHSRYSSDAPMSWQEVKAVKDRGVTVGSHTLDHVVLGPEQSPEVIRHQVIESRRLMIERLGECQVFAYPNGSTGDISFEALKAVEDAGYDYAFSTIPGVISADRLESNRLLLPRLSVSNDWNGFRKYVSTAWRHNSTHQAFVESIRGAPR